MPAGVDMAREFARQFYKSAAWQQARKLALIRDHGMCQTPGCFMPADEVHHIIELTPRNIGDPSIALSLDNLTCLCRECHRRVRRKISFRRKRKHGDRGADAPPVFETGSLIFRYRRPSLVLTDCAHKGCSIWPMKKTLYKYTTKRKESV